MNEDELNEQQNENQEPQTEVTPQAEEGQTTEGGENTGEEGSEESEEKKEGGINPVQPFAYAFTENNGKVGFISVPTQRNATWPDDADTSKIKYDGIDTWNGKEAATPIILNVIGIEAPTSSETTGEGDEGGTEPTGEGDGN